MSWGWLPALTCAGGEDGDWFGLVTFKTTGEALGNLPGHSYGKAEIKAKIDRLLDGS